MSIAAAAPRLRALLVLVLLPPALLAQSAGQRDEPWVCVASEKGSGWQCGRGAAAPATRPLPPPVARPQPALTALDAFADPGAASGVAGTGEDAVNAIGDALMGRTPAVSGAQTSASRPMIFAPGPRPPTNGPAVVAAGASPIPDGYSLRLASGATAEAIDDFAERFEVDPASALRGRIRADGGSRYLLLVGRYDTPAAALAAIAELPPLLRSLGPTVERIDDLAEPPVPFAPLTTAPAPRAPVEPIQKRVPAPPSAAEAEPRPSPVREAPPVAKTTPRVTATEPGRRARETGAPSPLPGVNAFAAASGPYTIQLANLPDAESVVAFLAQHELPRDGLFLVPGPGARQLLLRGRHATLAEAQEALAALPASLRGPWIRRSAPLSTSD